MKKLISKLGGKKKQPEEPAGRITTDTLAEHRERVLAGGRKFKYPVQYQRHKLVINTIIIATAAVLLLVGMGWYLLYSAQNTSEFLYRVTRVVPVPVAVIDGKQVQYSDYLMKYRSAEHYLVEKEQIDVSTEDGEAQLTFVKEQALQDAIADAYAEKLARELDIQVTDADLETFLKQQRQSSDGEVSETTYNAVILDYYGWSPEEYREAMKSKLLRQKVGYAVDSHASELSSSIEKTVTGGNTDLKTIADSLNAKEEGAVTYWAATWVPRNNQDGGLALAAAELENGQISKAIKSTSGDGYYYVKLVNSSASQVQYEYIQVPLKAFNQQLEAAESDDKLVKFITIDSITTNEE